MSRKYEYFVFLIIYELIYCAMNSVQYNNIKIHIALRVRGIHMCCLCLKHVRHHIFVCQVQWCIRVLSAYTGCCTMSNF